ncbi:MAG: TetR/AcrR family transcriptional regulator [Planctomycetota bacterium]
MAGRPRGFEPEQVVEGAVELFWSRGYDGTRVPDLVRELGICRQSLYKTFGDKRALFIAALERYGQERTQPFLRLLSSQGSPLENVRTVVRSWAHHASTCGGRGCMVVRAIADLDTSDESLVELTSGLVELLEQSLVDALTRAKEQGELGPDAVPERLAGLLVASVYGIALLSRLPSSQERIRDAVSTLLRVLDC